MFIKSIQSYNLFIILDIESLSKYSGRVSMPRVVFSERQPTGSQCWLKISVGKYTYIWRINSYVVDYYSGPGELLWCDFFCRAFLKIALRRRIDFSVFQRVLNMVLTVTLIYLIAKLQVTDRLDGNNIDLFGAKYTLNIFILATKYPTSLRRCQ